MKLVIASDIHGDLNSMKAVLSAYKEEGAEKSGREMLCG